MPKQSKKISITVANTSKQVAENEEEIVKAEDQVTPEEETIKADEQVKPEEAANEQASKPEETVKVDEEAVKSEEEEIVQIDEAAIKEELEKATVGQPESTRKMGGKLKTLLSDAIKDYKKREKTRAAEMFSIFAAHNFYSNGLTPVELRTTLEDLGPTYVKIGQIMSSRPDLLPEAYCKELEKLRQTVKPLPAEIARAVIEDETGKKIDEIYSEFRDKPLGSASIGQAHYGVLKDGTQVVTKVQRPLIADMMMRDFVLLKKLARLVNIVSDKGEDEQVVDLVSAIDELEKISAEELDFRVEAANTKFFKENCIEDENVVSCPTVIDELTTERIFTMTFVDGCSVAHKDKLIAEGCNVEEIGRALVNNYVHQVLDVGTFHADPHQGNIMVSHGKPYWIDFGMIGRISQKDIDLIQNMILSIINADTDGLINVIMSMGATSAKTNRDKLTADADIFLARFDGVNSINDVDISALFTDVMDLANKHNIQLPGNYTLLVRSVLAIEGVIEQLCPELNLMEIISNKLIERVKKSFDLKKAIIDAGKNIIGSGKKAAQIPSLAADALKGLTKGSMKVNTEVTGLDEPMAALGVYVKYVVLAFMSCIMFIGACILCTVRIEPVTSIGIPLLAVVLLIFSVALGIFSVIKLSKKDNK